MGTDKSCQICRKTWCSCESRKFTAEVIHKFYGHTKAEAERKLKQFYKSGGNELKGASMGSYPGQASENEYDKGVMKEIVSLFVTLAVTYSYTKEDLDEEVKNLMPRVDEAIDEYYQELNAEMAYERAREKGI